MNKRWVRHECQEPSFIISQLSPAPSPLPLIWHIQQEWNEGWRQTSTHRFVFPPSASRLECPPPQARRAWQPSWWEMCSEIRSTLSQLQRKTCVLPRHAGGRVVELRRWPPPFCTHIYSPWLVGNDLWGGLQVWFPLSGRGDATGDAVMRSEPLNQVLSPISLEPFSPGWTRTDIRLWAEHYGKHTHARLYLCDFQRHEPATYLDPNYPNSPTYPDLILTPTLKS